MSDLCARCGHSEVFHDMATGSGDLPAGTRYCDDRHSDPCDCAGFERLAPVVPIVRPRNVPAMTWTSPDDWRRPLGLVVVTCPKTYADDYETIHDHLVGKLKEKAMAAWPTGPLQIFNVRMDDKYTGDHELWVMEGDAYGEVYDPD